MTSRRFTILILSTVLVALGSCGGDTPGNPGDTTPTTSSAPVPLPPPANDHTNPLEVQRAKWPEQVAQLEEIIDSGFLENNGGSAGVIDGVLNIEVYDPTDVAEAERRWPDAVVVHVVVEYQLGG